MASSGSNGLLEGRMEVEGWESIGNFSMNAPVNMSDEILYQLLFLLSLLAPFEQ